MRVDDKTVENLETLITSNQVSKADVTDYFVRHKESLYFLGIDSLDQGTSPEYLLTGTAKPLPHTRSIILPSLPQEKILDNQAGTLSAKSVDAINTLQRACLKMILVDGIEIPSQEYAGYQELKLLKDEFKKATENKPFCKSEKWISSLFRELLKHNWNFIVVIGHSNEFEGRRSKALINETRSAFLEKGCVLYTFDQILFINRILSKSDFVIENDESSYHFSNETDYIFLTKDVIAKIQNALLHQGGDVRVYGPGEPPRPARVGDAREAIFKKNQAFNTNMLLASPILFPGVEKLLWAGFHKGNWMVAKERLSEPLIGEVVWYFFDPPLLTTYKPRDITDLVVALTDLFQQNS